jgi:hypothetical protein
MRQFVSRSTSAIGGSGVSVALGSGIGVSVKVTVGVSVGTTSVGVAVNSMVAMAVVVGGSVGGITSAVALLLGIVQAERMNIIVVRKQKSWKKVLCIVPLQYSSWDPIELRTLNTS